MVDINKIIVKIQNGLKNCSEQHNIDAKYVQLLINSSGKVHLWNSNVNVIQVDVLKVFKISAMENLLFPIVPFLKKALNGLSVKKNINSETAIARIFTKKDDFYPCVYLQDGDKIISEITIDELLNIK